MSIQMIKLHFAITNMTLDPMLTRYHDDSLTDQAQLNFFLATEALYRLIEIETLVHLILMQYKCGTSSTNCYYVEYHRKASMNNQLIDSGMVDYPLYSASPRFCLV